MPINWFKCSECGMEFRTKKSDPHHCPNASAEKLMSAPNTNFMEKVDPETGKSALVGQQKILRERARAHSRDIDTDDLIQMNPKDDSVKNHWVNDKGERRKKIDDL